MALKSGDRLGPYHVLSPLGQGGMGEVYRAHDTKLDRDVALKILPESFANDPDRLMRFEREAKTLASLNHPNIAQVYGIEDAHGARALVMELVDGEDLSQRMSGGAIPLADALPIARQIADALEAAHEAGIVHRDLKPANIKLKGVWGPTPTRLSNGRLEPPPSASDVAGCTVKVLDFGLAKPVQGDGSGVRPSVNSGRPERVEGHRQDPSPSTMTSPALTAMGLILGTAAYMSPEQARGKPVDERADIWAFGCVLYEMLTGRRAFGGDDISLTLASVLKDEVAWSALPSGLPVSIRRLLRRCLEKDPKRRLRAIGDARLELDEADHAEPATAHGAASRRGVAVAAAAALLLAGIAAAAAWYMKPVAMIPLRRLELPASIAAASEFALSPDGSRLAYFVDHHLYVRALDALEAKDLGTVPDSARDLIWSPDSRTIGFAADGEIRTMPAGGGAAFVVCKIPVPGLAIAATWLADGNILFAVWRESLYTVPAAGGTPVVAVALDPATEIDFHHVSALPDGRLILKTHRRKDDVVITQLVDRPSAGGPPHRTDISTDPTIIDVNYVAPGFLVFNRRTTNAGVWAVPFSDGPLDVTRATLLEARATDFSVAVDGTLVFGLPAVSRVSLGWVDRAGAASPIPGALLDTTGDASGSALDVALSPDGRRAIFSAGVGPDANLFVRDLASGVDTQLTLNKADGPSSAPKYGATFEAAWFPSGDRMLFTGGGAESVRLMVQRADMAGGARVLAAGLSRGRITADGRTLVGITDERGRGRLMRVPLSADGIAGAPQPVFQGEEAPDVVKADVSPDGRLVAYTARQPDNRFDLFLAELRTGAGRWLVAENASAPHFSRDGRELLYTKEVVDDKGQSTTRMMSTAVTESPVVKLGATTVLFDASGVDTFAERWDVAPDGRFLMLKAAPTRPGEGTRVVLLQNWPAVVRK